MRIMFYMLGVIPWVVAGAGLSAMDRPIVTEEMAQSHADARQRMVRTQIQAMGVRDETVLAAMLKVPRHLFVPEAYRPLAYADSPLPIGQGQTISQPYIVAYMTEALGLSPEDRVLEVGTGSGYQAAVLAEIVREVYSIEIIPELGKRAAERLESLGYRNVNVRIGDGYLGWPERAPFDAIIVTAAADKIPEPLVAQLKDGGKLCIPVGPTGSVQSLIRLTKRGQQVERENLLPVRFVPLVHPD